MLQRNYSKYPYVTNLLIDIQIIKGCILKYSSDKLASGILVRSGQCLGASLVQFLCSVDKVSFFILFLS